MGGANLCGLDDSQVVDAAESGAHGRSESRRAEVHVAEEPRPQLIVPARRHQGHHLGPSPGVLPAKHRTRPPVTLTHSQLGQQRLFLMLTNQSIVFPIS